MSENAVLGHAAQLGELSHITGAGRVTFAAENTGRFGESWQDQLASNFDE